MKYLKNIIITLPILILVGILFLHKDIRKRPYYVSSNKCRNCHERLYESWSNTLHPKMFRPVRTPDDILGDFDSRDPALTFTKKEVEYVVGNKWEQVYVRVIDGEYYPLPAKWHVIKKQWAPYKVKTWKQTPMSKKCNGCHTTGFDPNTLEFNEFGIGCEACHGPGSVHVQNTTMASSFVCALCHNESRNYKNDIITFVSGSVCAQCHNRGVNAPSEEIREAEFNFPVNYIPGDDLSKYFVQKTVKEDEKKQFWWGRGLSKNRHQEYADWIDSKHSKALRLLLEKHIKDNRRGQLTDECLECHSTDYRHAKKQSKPTLESARFGVTCVACHEPHGLDKMSSLTKDGPYKCSGCHTDSISLQTARKGEPHYPCPPGMVRCADCHMPYIIKAGGFFSLRSHAFKIIPPAATQEFDMPNSCQNGGCHKNKPIEWALEKFKEYYQ